MAVMRWQGDKKMEELFVGICEQSVATIFRSNKGTCWRAHIELPLRNNLWKRWLPYQEVKEITERLVDEWITFASMDPPAKDSPE